MIKKVKAYAEEHNMLEAFDKIIVGVSGGADSICLLLILLEIKKTMPLELVCIHVHHGIREEEADRDAFFVESFCKERDITFLMQRYDVKSIASKEKISEEEAGRNLRYALFHQMKEKFSCNKIAVAHNKGDQVETILFNLCRGAGVAGLKGMEAVSGDIIRPLLSCSRKEIEEYLSLEGIKWCTDSTNLTSQYMRNKIRLELIPLLEREINPMSQEHIWGTGNRLKEVNDYLSKQVEVAYKKLTIVSENKILIPIVDLKKEDTLIQKMLIRKGLEDLSSSLKDITSKHIENLLDLLDNTVGKYVMLPYGMRGIRDYENLVIENWNQVNQEDFQPLSITIGEVREFYLKGKRYTVSLELISLTEEKDLKDYKRNPQNSYTKWFDYDKIIGNLHIRTRRDGDFLEINSNGARKKLKKFFIDNKILQRERDCILLLAEDSHILWVVGHRMSERYKVSENTKQILKVQIDGGR